MQVGPQLAEKLLADGVDGARAVADLSRQAIRVVQECDRRIAYAPAQSSSIQSCCTSPHKTLS
jgi:hypothetical protein